MPNRLRIIHIIRVFMHLNETLVGRIIIYAQDFIRAHYSKNNNIVLDELIFAKGVRAVVLLFYSNRFHIIYVIGCLIYFLFCLRRFNKASRYCCCSCNSTFTHVYTYRVFCSIHFFSLSREYYFVRAHNMCIEYYADKYFTATIIHKLSRILLIRHIFFRLAAMRAFRPNVRRALSRILFYIYYRE